MEINGRKAKSLSLPQVRRLREFDDPNAADLYALEAAYGEDMAEWFNTAPAGDALRAIAHVWDVSGLTEDARFPDATSDDAGNGGDGVGD